MSAAMTLWVFILGIACGIACLGFAFAAFLYSRRLQAELLERMAGLPTITEIREAEGRLKSLANDLEALRAQEAEARRSIAAADAARAELAALREQISSLDPKRAELVALEGRLEQVRQAVERSEKDLASVRAALSQAAAEEEARRAKLGQLEGSIRDATQRLDAIQAELAGLLAARAEAAQALAALKAEIESLTSARASLQQDVGALQGRVSQLEEIVRQLERRADEAKAACDAAERRVADARSEIDDLTSRKRKLEDELSDARRHLASLQSEVAKIQPAASVEVRLEAVFKDPPLTAGGGIDKFAEAEAIRKVEAHAKSLGFVYSQRVIKAFHTSLKIDSRAPLMVLAGISGTGKTQLPRLYADALGMHFLPVSVQPGWDSPQDLLGFFSHLENRFRPTALLQALVQMDRYIGRDALKGSAYKPLEKLWRDHERSDEMLLVLLDEMNLARVEYYFSDFLSKLELRNSRGFDPDIAESRRRASVFLEGGPGSEGIPVLPGHNVLFVGTMNEDESTQSLSDKVVDRANVMRFGTPRKLQTGGGTAVARKGDPKRLSRESWESWRVAGESPLEVGGKGLGHWIGRLNDALVSVHRPFGHRTAGAITEYVRQYPTGADRESALKAALADQIEQRVMPKLRGIDPQGDDGQSAFNGIRQIVEELGDTELRTAISRGEAAHGGSQFVWFGVDRGVE